MEEWREGTDSPADLAPDERLMPHHCSVHLLLGGNGINAQEDALQADAASRVLLHCCTARDSVYTVRVCTGCVGLCFGRVRAGGAVYGPHDYLTTQGRLVPRVTRPFDFLTK